MKSKIIILFIAFLLGTVFSLALMVKQGNLTFAANNNLAANTSNTPNQPTNGDAGGFVPCGNTADNPCNVTHLFRAFIVIINYLIGMAGFVAVFAIIYAGLLMVTSQGTERLTAAKRKLSGAIIGMVIVAAAFVLVNALFTGSLSIGVCNGGDILSNPRAYIQGGASCN